jgi:hypothetical protein
VIYQDVESADAREKINSFATDFGQRKALVLHPDFFIHELHFGYFLTAEATPDPAAISLDIPGQIRPGQNDGIGASDTSKRLAPATQWEEGFLSEIEGGVNEQDVEVTMQPSMLKTVIDNNHLRPELAVGEPGGTVLRFRNGEKHLREDFRHHHDLVAGLNCAFPDYFTPDGQDVSFAFPAVA